jgi:N-acylglucosamine-6-phosphate 2-epimerase
MMAAMAQAAVGGGAVAIRANGPEDVRAIANVVQVPILGIHKIGRVGVYITPTPEAVFEIVAAGASLVAVDGTTRLRPDGRSFAEQLKQIRCSTDVPIMADVDCLEAGLRARAAGADAVATTLSGYVGDVHPAGPDFELIAALAAELDCPIVAEGRLRTDADVVTARQAGAHAIVIGTAITNPAAITRGFATALAGARP